MLSSSLQNQLKHLRDQGKKITLVTGVFDLLHQEHKLFLEKASKIGDVLVVGVESDTRVRQMKGQGRPIENQEQRLASIQKLLYIDIAFILPEQFSKLEDYDQFVAETLPTYLAVSSHTDYQDVKEKLMKKYGGELKIVHEHNPHVSTTILEKELVR